MSACARSAIHMSDRCDCMYTAATSAASDTVSPDKKREFESSAAYRVSWPPDRAVCARELRLYIMSRVSAQNGVKVPPLEQTVVCV